MPTPSSVTRIRASPPISISTRTRVAPASREFSTSSLTTLDGLSTTSPAAILFARSTGRRRTGGMKPSSAKDAGRPLGSKVLPLPDRVLRRAEERARTPPGQGDHHQQASQSLQNHPAHREVSHEVRDREFRGAHVRGQKESRRHQGGSSERYLHECSARSLTSRHGSRRQRDHGPPKNEGTDPQRKLTLLRALEDVVEALGSLSEERPFVLAEEMFLVAIERLPELASIFPVEGDDAATRHEPYRAQEPRRDERHKQVPRPRGP